MATSEGKFSLQRTIYLTNYLTKKRNIFHRTLFDIWSLLSWARNIRLLWEPVVHYHVHKILQVTLSWVTTIQSTYSYSVFLTYTLILFPHPCKWPTVPSYTEIFRQQILCAFLVSYKRDTTSAHLILLYLIILTMLRAEQKITKFFSLQNLLQFHTTSSLLHPNVLLSILSSYTLSTRSFTIRKHIILFLHILNSRFVDRKLENIRFWTESRPEFLERHMVLSSSCLTIIFPCKDDTRICHSLL